MFDNHETTQLIANYRKLLDQHMTLPKGFISVMIICLGSPDSDIRAAFTAMLISIDDDFAKWSANETYREAMMKD